MTLAIASDLMATLEREEFREALERFAISSNRPLIWLSSWWKRFCD